MTQEVFDGQPCVRQQQTQWVISLSPRTGKVWQLLPMIAVFVEFSRCRQNRSVFSLFHQSESTRTLLRRGQRRRCFCLHFGCLCFLLRWILRLRHPPPPTPICAAPRSDLAFRGLGSPHFETVTESKVGKRRWRPTTTLEILDNKKLPQIRMTQDQIDPLPNIFTFQVHTVDTCHNICKIRCMFLFHINPKYNSVLEGKIIKTL